jgi:hypothetical protein
VRSSRHANVKRGKRKTERYIKYNGGNSKGRYITIITKQKIFAKTDVKHIAECQRI